VINKYSNLVLQCGYLFVVFFKNIQLILEQIKKLNGKMEQIQIKKKYKKFDYLINNKLELSKNKKYINT